MKLTKDDLARLCPRPKKTGTAQTNWDGYIAAMTSPEGYNLFQDYGVDTRLELCAFIANCAEETGDYGGFTALWENLSFASVAAIRRAWGSRASKYSNSWISQHLLRNPQALGAWAYNGRMGNVIGTDDGYRYRGFGILQTTGKDSHLRYLKGDYSYLSALRAALSEWRDKSCGDHVNNGDFITACVLINGGRNGLADRQRYFAQAKKIWTAAPDWTHDTAVAASPLDIDDDPNDDATSLTLPPFIPPDMQPPTTAVAMATPMPLPDMVTAQDLQDVSKKVSLLAKARLWLTGITIGGGGLGFADLQQGATTAHSVLPVVQEYSPFIIAGMAIAGLVVASALIAWIVEDYNSKRYQPSGVVK